MIERQFSSAEHQLRNVLAPRPGSAMKDAFVDLCLAESSAKLQKSLGVYMNGMLRNNSWIQAGCRSLAETEGASATHSNHFVDIHMARRERLRERLQDPTDPLRVHSLIAVTAFHGCIAAAEQVTYMESLLDAGYKIGVVPQVTPDTADSSLTSVLIFDDRAAYTQFEPAAPTDTHEAFYHDHDEPERIARYLAAYQAALAHAQPIEPALYDLRHYGEVRPETYAPTA